MKQIGFLVVMLLALSASANEDDASQASNVVDQQLQSMEDWLAARSERQMNEALTRWQALDRAQQEQLRYRLAIRARDLEWPALRPVLEAWQEETAQIRQQREHHRQWLEEAVFPYPNAAAGTLRIWQWRERADQLSGSLNRGDCEAAVAQVGDLPLDWLHHAVRQSAFDCTAQLSEAPRLALVASLFGSPLNALERQHALAELTPAQARRLYFLAAAVLDAEARWAWADSLRLAHSGTASLVDHEAAQLERIGVVSAADYLRQRLQEGHGEAWFATVRFASDALLDEQLARVMALGGADEQRLLAAALVTHERPGRAQRLQRMADSPHLASSVRDYLWEVQQ